jgi:hypothetical protein
LRLVVWNEFWDSVYLPSRSSRSYKEPGGGRVWWIFTMSGLTRLLSWVDERDEADGASSSSWVWYVVMGGDEGLWVGVFFLGSELVYGSFDVSMKGC